ncbi:MAG: hypothetical protein KDA66_02765 [Planctomycetaceae bacterium]|nr:hypothetical protein [Planctomycetaceae bacterium]MCB9951331.1 RNAase [Planctomycetaceae bacterium]
MFQASNDYSVVDPDTGEEILHGHEPNVGFFTKMLRFTWFKRMPPFDMHITTPDGDPVLYITRGISLFLSNVDVLDENDEHIGGFNQKLFSVVNAFNVSGDEDKTLCSLHGKWAEWEFQLEKNGVTYATITRTWTGIDKQRFTSADDYILDISDEVPKDHPLRMLIVGAVFCIDMVLKV